ncbi:Fe-S oxidoreductase [Bacillus canaveralius]|uniref:Fe-S oxidoreductase n=2 Tax=Bacillaceae TaxID=186817 RepID=A0A2N5GL33_9BACI|nr:Fe-S oxidoreductase [Bacillus canaveralius]PLR84007.1 Fe-S oxidoreductase [Bacillus sp. V33-4]PLR97915.1 Fe-S oxidoreductase [Bacillus canaveralius]
MHIELDDKAKVWIESKGKHLTVKTVEVKGCCVGGVQELLAIPKKPKDINKYNEFRVDNLSIFIQKNINIKDRIQLKISGFGFLTSITAKGFLE